MARRQTGGRVKAAIFLLVSVLAAVVASMVIYTVISNYQQQLVEVQKPEEMIQVVTAKVDLHQGATITEETVIMSELPPAYVPDSVFRSADEVMGRVPRERILANEFIRSERLANPEAGVGLNAIIPRGMRAISINISQGSAVSGFLNPGNYVDVLVTVNDSETQERETITMLQAVTVLAVNERMASGAGASRKTQPSVTLAVTPSDGEKLAHAMAEGAVVLTLRNDIDVTQVEMHGEITDEEGRIGKDDLSRTSISAWQRKKRGSRDGSLLIIRGHDETKERN